MARRRKRAALFAGLVLGPAAATAAIVAVLVQGSAPPPFDHPALVRAGDVRGGVEVVVEGGARVPAVPLGENVHLVP